MLAKQELKDIVGSSPITRSINGNEEAGSSLCLGDKDSRVRSPGFRPIENASFPIRNEEAGSSVSFGNWRAGFNSLVPDRFFLQIPNIFQYNDLVRATVMVADNVGDELGLGVEKWACGQIGKGAGFRHRRSKVLRVRNPPGPLKYYACVPQLVEGASSNLVQCRFEPDRRYQMSIYPNW